MTERIFLLGLMPALAGALAGCATTTSAPRQNMLSAAQSFLDQHEVCALLPEQVSRSGGARAIRRADTNLLQPFVEAGLITLIEQGPASMRSSRQWFLLSDAGSRLLTECLVQTAHPQRHAYGFRIGSRVAMQVSPMSRPTQLRCYSVASARVTYRMQMDSPWFRPHRFRTNMLAMGVDEASGQGTTLMPYAWEGNAWSQVDRTDPYSNTLCLSQEGPTGVARPRF